jgi:glycosyltransferase involved in cell wall biosynthesis
VGEGKIRVVCFGPGPKFKGGISNYNTSLAKAFDKMPNVECHIISWTQQYPAIIPREFVDKTSKGDLLEGTDIKVHYGLNYNDPFSWRKTLKFIRGLKPDYVIFQWAIAIQGIPLGWIVRRLSKDPQTTVLMDLHFVIQKERSKIDMSSTRYGISKANGYVVHTLKTLDELKTLFPGRDFYLREKGKPSGKGMPVTKLYHPVYDIFKPDPEFDVEAFKKENGLKKNVFLFFGFIRKYKGLHFAIEAFKKLSDKRDDVSLIVCGESFWKTLDENKLSTRIKSALFGTAKKIFLNQSDDEGKYNPMALIDEFEIADKVMVNNQFVPNEDVHKYFQVSDAVLLFYEYATPSGVESLSYNFKLPVLATNVGHFPETIKDGYNGYLAKAEDTDSMAAAMESFLDNPIPVENVVETSKEMTWDNYARAIFEGA